MGGSETVKVVFYGLMRNTHETFFLIAKIVPSKFTKLIIIMASHFF